MLPKAIFFDLDDTIIPLKGTANDTWNIILRYQNIIWILIFIIIAGLVALICVDNKERISTFLRKF